MTGSRRQLRAIGRSAKEVVRHAAGRAGLGMAVRAIQEHRGRVVAHLDAGDLESTFDSAYRSAAWVLDEGQESPSGVGSSLAATSSLRAHLPPLLEQLGCEVLLDLGCGDLNWMRQLQLDCQYVGVDIVPQLVADLQATFGDASRSFVCLDATKDPLPAADVVLCREVLFHLSFRDLAQVLTNIRSSGARYLLATTNDELYFNSDIPSGAFRELNLRRRPVRLGEPMQRIPDDAVSPGRALGVWVLGTAQDAPRGRA